MIIPHSSIDTKILNSIIEEFVLREGTDYGHQDYSLEQKVSKVIKQLVKGDVVVSFDEETETCSIVSKDSCLL